MKAGDDTSKAKKKASKAQNWSSQQASHAQIRQRPNELGKVSFSLLH